VLTAGHCTDLGGTWTTSSGRTIGPVAASSFPGNDYGAIRISSPAALDPRGGVLHNGAFRDITGRRPGPGRLGGLQDRVDHGHDLRHRPGLQRHRELRRRHRLRPDRTNICTQPGDSGGALYAGSLAQGITSGGTVGGCSQAGFRSFFQPVGEALSTFGLTLL
jgi:hypothetical protein